MGPLEAMRGTFVTKAITGQTLTFTGRAFNARSRPIRWYLMGFSALVGAHDAIGMDLGDGFEAESYQPEVEYYVAEGDSATFQYTVRQSDIGEDFSVVVRIMSNSPHHRHRRFGGPPGGDSGYDDGRSFQYAVNPPDED